jgi:hypothetical protein
MGSGFLVSSHCLISPPFLDTQSLSSTLAAVSPKSATDATGLLDGETPNDTLLA